MDCKLSAWYWLLNFNANFKSMILKIRASLNYLYTGWCPSEVSQQSQRLWSLWHHYDLKPRNRITSISSKANQRVELIKQHFIHLQFDLIGTLFSRIHCEAYTVLLQQWSPALINGLKRVQKLLSCWLSQIWQMRAALNGSLQLESAAEISQTTVRCTTTLSTACMEDSYGIAEGPSTVSCENLKSVISSGWLKTGGVR